MSVPWAFCLNCLPSSNLSKITIHQKVTTISPNNRLFDPRAIVALVFGKKNLRFKTIAFKKYLS